MDGAVIVEVVIMALILLPGSIRYGYPGILNCLSHRLRHVPIQESIPCGSTQPRLRLQVWAVW